MSSRFHTNYRGPQARMRYESQTVLYEQTVPLEAYEDLDSFDLPDGFSADAPEEDEQSAHALASHPAKPIIEMNGKELGSYGEDLAADFLVEGGYQILERGYRCDAGEADIVAYDPIDEQVVLVEVKSRRGARRYRDGYPEEAVTAKKQRRYHRIAACYVMENFPVPSVRFDVVSVWFGRDAVEEIVHTKAAFDWDAGR